MARFDYTAEKNGGEVYHGTAEAPDRFALYQIVRQEGGKLLALQEQNANKWRSLAYWNSLLTRIKEYEKILFARNLGAMLGAGLSLSRALAVMERQTRNPKMLTVVTAISGDVRRGESLHDALGKFPAVFPKLFKAMVRAGEEGGNLSQSLQVTADQMERMYTLKKKVRGALIYPCIILVAIVGIGILMMIEVVPTLAQTFAEMKVDLPPSTRIVIGISDFLTHDSLLAAALGIVAAGVLLAAWRSVWGKRAFEFLILRIPVIGGLVREVNAARTARTLSSLLAAGVDVITSLDITREVVQNSFFKSVIRDAARAVAAGEALSVSFMKREDLYPPFVGEMMAVGEETGQLAEMMKRLASYYEDEVDRNTKDLSTVVEPFLMIIIGTAVGFFAVSMITPIYSLSNVIN